MALSFAFGGDDNLSYEELQQRRKVLNAMMGRATAAPKNFGEGLTAIGQALGDRFENGRLTDQEKAARATANADAAGLMGALGIGASSSPASIPSTSGAAAAGSTDPVASGLDPQQGALLNAIAGPESAGKYNVRYTPTGGATFDSFAKHPGIAAPGPDGPSTAAGRYQFTKTTWDSLPASVKGDGTFSPENQDRAALYLAGQDYQKRTGRDLNADLAQNGFTPQIASALGPTWLGLRDNPGKAIGAYNSTLSRYDSQQDAAQDAQLGEGPSVDMASLPAPVRSVIADNSMPMPPSRPVQVASLGNVATDALPESALPPQTTAAPVARSPFAPDWNRYPGQFQPQKAPTMAAMPLGMMPQGGFSGDSTGSIPPQTAPHAPGGVQQVAQAVQQRGMPVAPAQASPPAVQQVAQAIGAQQQAPQPSAPPAAAGMSQAQLAAAQRILSNPYATKGQQAVAQAIIQKQVAIASRDPTEMALKQEQLRAAQATNANAPLNAQLLQADLDAKRAALGNAPLDRRLKEKQLNKSDDPTLVQEYKFAQSQGETRPFTDWAAAKAKAGATSVNVGGGSDKQVFDLFAENTKEARAAATGLIALRNARTALQGPGGAITGFGADARLSLQKAGALLGVTKPEAIQNTETFRAAIAPQVAAMLKSTVGTNQISNSDREFAEKASGGSIQLDAGSISRLLGIMEKAAAARLQLHQQQLDAVYPDPQANRRERALFSVTVPEGPSSAAPTGPARPSNKAEYDALPSGTTFVAPDGTTRRKP
mgnify:CR=1 FL=1